MEITLPEELTREEVHFLCSDLQTKHPKVFAECVDLKHFTPLQKLRILDEMLMEHPDLYCAFFEQEPER